MPFVDMENLLVELKAAGTTRDILPQEQRSDTIPTEKKELAAEPESECSRLKVAAWVSILKRDSEDLWKSAESKEIWEFHGQNVCDLAKNWFAYTLVWILPLIKAEDSTLGERTYSKYISRFYAVRASKLMEMRASHYRAGVDRVSHILDPLSTSLAICDELATSVSQEKEQGSILFHILRKRPDLFL